MTAITLFLSTHGQPTGRHAFTIANDDLPDRPAAAASSARRVRAR